MKKMRDEQNCLILASISAFFLLQPLGVASANCTNKGMAVTGPKIEGFLIRPLSLLERSPHGDRELVTAIAELVAADDRMTLIAIIGVTRAANLEQKRAVGLGLASAVDRCRFLRPEIARRITQIVIQRADGTVTSAFLGSDLPRPSPEPRPSGKLRPASPPRDPFAPIPVPGD